MWLFGIAAAGVSALFGAILLAQWVGGRRPHLLAWGLAMLLFAVASFTAGIGVLNGWSPGLFRIYYLLGAIVNVPVLGLGTVYLLAPRKVANAAAILVLLATVFATGAAFAADLNVAGLVTDGIPSGRAVASEDLRALSRYYSYAGAIVVVAGAVWSALRLARKREPELRRLVQANALIAVGTGVVAASGALARYGRGSVLSVGLLAGVSTMFAGFLKTRARPTVAADSTEAMERSSTEPA